MMNNKVYKTTICGAVNACISIGSNGLTGVQFVRSNKKGFKLNGKLRKWLKNYLGGKNPKFPYPLNIKGTAFQKAVWKTLMKIPFGETRTYGWVAKKIGRPKAVRAVGTACGANPVPIIIPCHRAVASNSLGGFSSGLNIKKKLLKLETAI